MSGGHFVDHSYTYYRVEQFADELENDIKNNEKPDEYGYAYNYDQKTIAYLQSQLPQLRKMAKIMRAMDYLYSGDHSEKSFLAIVKELDKE